MKLAPASAVTVLDELWARVELADGSVYEVSRRQRGPMGIGQAEEMAKAEGLDLPSPDEVDMVWAAADLRIAPMPRTFKRWTPDEMNSQETLEDQIERIGAAIGGREFKILAGEYKDVVRGHDGKVGLYGWHRLDGTPIQPYFTGHALAYADYSQSLRLIRRTH